MGLEFYKGKKVLITGHTGFKGTWLAKILLDAGAKVSGLSLESDTVPSLYDLTGIGKNIDESIFDIRDYGATLSIVRSRKPDIVFHLAAQPIVRISYDEPVRTFQTNVMGTVNILDAVRRTDSVRSVVNVTTDKVYLNEDKDIAFTEDMPLDGYDPYSNSKSCSELVTHSYSKSFFGGRQVSISTARAGNVIGGGDFSKDRIIPDCVRAALNREEIIVRNPSSIRPFQHVLEPLFAYLLIAEKQFGHKELEGAYNVGPEISDCISAGEITKLFVQSWGQGLTRIDRSDGGPHEASFLRLDCTKIKETLGWKCVWDIKKAVEETVNWTKVYAAGGDVVAEMEREIQEFIRDRGEEDV
ncbi:MAG: CDP-glucose 4,6-dehydratase [Lachnospiraceae bacterium]|nr:CDP-glucose 4,6-dehydratase [Lachnospiraceae bacterium]